MIRWSFTSAYHILRNSSFAVLNSPKKLRMKVSRLATDFWLPHLPSTAISENLQHMSEPLPMKVAPMLLLISGR